jgi:hypothetical protein
MWKILLQGHILLLIIIAKGVLEDTIDVDTHYDVFLAEKTAHNWHWC